MKNYRLLLPVAFVAVLLVGCKDKKASEGPILRPSSMVYSQQDTLTVQGMVDMCVEALKNNDIETAANLLYTVENDSVAPLSEEKKRSFINALSMFEIYDVKSNGYTLRSDVNNQITLTLLIDPEGDLSEDKGVTRFSLNPVVLDGQWYLTLIDVNSENYEEQYYEGK